MKAIYKYPIQITDYQSIETYEDYFILSVKIQNGKPFIWVVVDTSQTKNNLYGTYLK